MKNKISFSINGEFVTKLAREKLFQEKDIAYAISLLDACTKTDELTDDERMLIILKILNGDAQINGVYPEDSYGVEILNDKQVTSDNTVFQIAKILLEQHKKQVEEYQCLQHKYIQLLDRFAFVAERLGYFEKQKLDNQYQTEGFSEWLFDDVLDESDRSLFAKNNELNSYLARVKLSEKTNGEDYGWLEPDGTFHPVEWAHHAEFAREYMESKYPYEDFAEMYWSEDHKEHLDNNDILIDKLGWILLHNPSQGLPFHHVSEKKNMTKAQKEFLYDFYTERNMYKEAKELFE